MSKIIFLTRQNNLNAAINNKLKEKMDCDFVQINAKGIIDSATAHAAKLVVIFLSKLTTDEELEVQKFLKFSGSIPVVLAGEKRELDKYYDKTPAKILRYVVTPILLSQFVKEIQKVLNKLEGKEEETSAEPEVIEAAPKHILVIDDDVIMLRTISAWLNDLFTVSVAKSGASGLQFLAKQIPDLILLDYEMPVCNGIQTLQMIRNEPSLKDIPVFFLTGVNDTEKVKAAIELKPQGYILKSKGPDYLISKIESFL